ncbi:hypothetical protein AcV5_007961 [Taiwanofungus camphoratus]|nr:hypothetical protein AcV5_007961 [Antrodia cinnamomea]
MYSFALISVFTTCVSVALSVRASPILSTTGSSLSAVQKSLNDANIPVDANITFNPNVLLDVIFPQNTSSPSMPVVLSAPNTTLSIAGAHNIDVIEYFYSIEQFTEVTFAPSFVLVGEHLCAADKSPSVSPIQHFLGGDFESITPPVVDMALLSNSTPAISEWISPAPPTADLHRYVVLIFKQSSGFENQTFVNASTNRLN